MKSRPPIANDSSRIFYHNRASTTPPRSDHEMIIGNLYLFNFNK